MSHWIFPYAIHRHRPHNLALILASCYTCTHRHTVTQSQRDPHSYIFNNNRQWMAMMTIVSLAYPKWMKTGITFRMFYRHITMKLIGWCVCVWCILCARLCHCMGVVFEPLHIENEEIRCVSHRRVYFLMCVCVAVNICVCNIFFSVLWSKHSRHCIGNINSS